MVALKITPNLLPKRIGDRAACQCADGVCECYAKRGGIKLASEYVGSASACGIDITEAGLKRAASTLTYSDDAMSFLKASFMLDKELDAKEIEFRKSHNITPCMDFEAVITSTRQDRDYDILECKGAEIDPVMPLLWQHIAEMPIGKFLRVTFRDDNQIRGASSIIDSPMGRDAAQLLEFGALRISHGFKPKRVEQLQQGPDDLWAGYHIPAYRMFEKSLVSVPSNPDAIITAYSRQKLHDPFVKAWAKGYYDRRPTMVRGGYDPKGDPKAGTRRIKPIMMLAKDEETVRWNPKLSKSFDVENAHLEPSSTLIDWVGKWLEVPTKRIFQTSIPIPSVRMGTFLTALKNVLGEKQIKSVDVRNVYGATESPPQYEKVELNSTKSDTFLVLGTEFFTGQDRIVVDYSRQYYGIDLTFFSTWESRSIVETIVDRSFEWASKNNFLRGEKFAIAGNFLEKTGEDFADLFLEPENEKALKLVLDRMNKEGAAFVNHGTLMMGPPGTGKTLSGRIFLNKANATFIWVSAKDFYRMGAFGGMAMAFDLAKELAPTVLFIEDVDNWIDSWTVDYLKTEMDGIARSSGVLTMLTTNFPELLPEALTDRPGRFTDTLKFGLPTAEVRTAMLAKWLPDVTEKAREDAVAETDGMSGAHLYHLARFAKDLVAAEQKSFDDALLAAIAKTKEQRELIAGVQLQGSRYRPSREFDGAATKSIGVWIKGAVPFKATPKRIETETWKHENAVYNVRSWAGVYGNGSEPPAEAWKTYATAFAWFDGETSDQFDAYKLLHHDVVDEKLVVNFEGVKAAMRDLLSSKSIPDVDRRKAYAHLAQHYEQFGKTPPGYKGGTEPMCNKCQKSECTCSGKTKAARLTERRIGLLNNAKAKMKEAMEHEEMNDQDDAKSFVKCASYKVGKALPMMSEPDPEDPDEDEENEDTDGKPDPTEEEKAKQATLTEKRKNLLTAACGHLDDAHDHEGMGGKTFAQALIKSARQMIDDAMPKKKEPKAGASPDAGGNQTPGKPGLPAGVGEANPGMTPAENNPLAPAQIQTNANNLAVKMLATVAAGDVPWQTLHDLRDGVDQEINRQESAAAANAEAVLS